MTEQRQDDQHDHTFSNYVEYMGCSPEDLPEAMNDRENGERGSGISVLPARHDDHDDVMLKANISRRKIMLDFDS